MSATDDPRVLIVDDHELFSMALSTALTRSGLVSEATCVPTGTAALDLAAKEHFDLFLIDLGLEDMNGLLVLQRLLEKDPTRRVCVLSGNTERGPMVQAVLAGACGYLAKTIDLEEFVEKVRLALEGNQVYDETSAATIIEGFSNDVPSVTLSARELEVLVLLGQGATNEQAAASLLLSPHTIKDVVKHIFDKLGVNDRASAVATGFRLGLLR